MSKFGIKPVKKLTTIEYTIHAITLNNGESPIIEIKPANDTNKPYISALLRNNAQVRRAQRVTLKAMERNRQDDVELYAKHIIVNWKHVIDEKANPVKYTPSEGIDFLTEIVKDNGWIFDDLRMFCSDMSNFIEEGANDEDQDALLKN